MNTAKTTNPWILSIRPKTLPAGAAPIIMGSAMAWGDGAFSWVAFFVCLFTALLLQIGANLSNDYYDGIKGTDATGRKGPTRVTQAGLIKPGAVRIAFMVVFAAAFTGWIYLSVIAGWPIIVCGLLAIFAGILYTAGPLPLGYIGLGDIMVLVFFGPAAVTGSYFVQAHSITIPSLLGGVAAGLFSVAILTVNNLRDIESDRVAGKKTLAVRFGVPFARTEYFGCLMIAALIPVLIVVMTRSHHWILLSLLFLPLCIPSVRIVAKETEGNALNGTLGATARFFLVYAMLFSIGWIV